MRILALGGIAGPALFVSVALLCAALRPDYSHVDQFISELGASGTPHAALMNYAGFLPSGLLIAGFGASLAWLLPGSRLTILAAILVGVFGGGVSAAGVFSCDPGCPQGSGSLENLIHDRTAPITFLSAIAATFLLGARFRALPDWRPLWVFSVASGAVALLSLAAMAASLETRSLTGLWQRSLLAALYLWCVVTGVRAFRSAASPSPRSG